MGCTFVELVRPEERWVKKCSGVCNIVGNRVCAIISQGVSQWMRKLEKSGDPLFCCWGGGVKKRELYKHGRSVVSGYGGEKSNVSEIMA